MLDHQEIIISRRGSSFMVGEWKGQIAGSIAPDVVATECLSLAH